MTRLRALHPALGAVAAGLVLACFSHPTVAAAIVSALGETPRRALPLDHLGALALHHLILAGTGLVLVAITGIGLGILVSSGLVALLPGFLVFIGALELAGKSLVVRPSRVRSG